MANGAEEQSNKIIKVVLRDLKGLLRGELGDNLIIDGFETSSLVGPGENYGSTMLKVDAEVRRNGKNSKSEKLFFVAKMIPPTEFQKIIFDSPVTFPKEIYMFTDIVPAYQVLERECGIPEREVFDPLPKLYGSRLSLEGSGNEFDEDAVILMENLKVKNYICGNRKIGLDLAHAKAIVEALARFHAVGIAVKIKKPELFQKFRNRAKFSDAPDVGTDMFPEFIIKNVACIPDLSPYTSRIEEVVKSTDAFHSTRPAQEPWGSISHTDLWVNNVMYRDDSSGNPEAVKFVDFQHYTYENPMRDLVFFLFTSCNKEVRNTSINDLIDLYYGTFISHLTRLKCDTSVFSRKSYDEQFADAAYYEYVHCVIMIRPIIMDQETELVKNLTPDQLFQEKPTNEYLEYITALSLKFIKENWI